MFQGGDGGSGTYGSGGGPQQGAGVSLPSNGSNASGNSANGDGDANSGGQPTVNGNNGSPGIWIIEEYA